MNDEVQSGCGRTGPVWAIEHYGVEPDLLVSGKTLGGGLPLAAVTGRAEVMDAVPAGGLGGTFGGNPLSCAAAIAILDALARRAPRAEEIGDTPARRGSRRWHRAGSEVRGLGPMLALELPEQTRRRDDAHHRRGARAGADAPLLRDLRQRDPHPRAVRDRATRSSSAGSTSSRAALAADVAVEGGRKTYGDVVAVDGVDLDGRRRRVLHAARPVGLGQDDDAAHDRRLRAARRAARSRSAARTSRDRPPYARDVNTVFQDYALFPHMTVAENVGYGLKVKGVPRGERATRRSTRCCGWCGSTATATASRSSSPAASASGSRSRARSSTSPKVLLLDEPLGALDLKLRQEMQVFLKALQRDLGMTFLYVTHDQEEALTMSDHVAVFNEGRIEQVGAPEEVYERPATEFVAGFVGTSNILERDGRRFSVRPERIALERARRAGNGRRRRLRRRVHALPRRHRRRRAADRRPPERRPPLEPGARVQARLARRGRLRDPATPNNHYRRQMTKRMWALVALARGRARVPGRRRRRSRAAARST